MIRHMVLFRFKPEATDAERRAVRDGLARLPSHFPAMRRFGVGGNISRRDTAFPHVMTIEFERHAELETYLDSAGHERCVATVFRPAIKARAIASYQCVPEPGR